MSIELSDIELSDIVSLIITLVCTYWVHSTLLLGGVWMGVKLCPTVGDYVREQLWKLAALLGLFTTLAQLMLFNSLIEFQLATPAANDPLTEFSAVMPAAPSPDGSIGAKRRAPRHSFPDLPRGKQAASVPRTLNASDRPNSSSQVMIRSAARGDDQRSGGPLPDRRLNLAEVGMRWWIAALNSATVCLLLVWAAGVSSLVMRARRFRRHYANALTLEHGPARRALDRFLTRNKIARRVQLFAAENCCEPLTFGIWDWTIVIPLPSERILTADELEAAFAHELAHHVRRDLWWLAFGRVLCMLLPVQPLNFLARRRWQDSAEVLCDDWAVQHGVCPRALATCLIHIAEQRMAPQSPTASLAAAGSGENLASRVRRLLDVPTPPRQPPRWRVRSLAAAVAAIVVVLAPQVVFSAAPAGSRNPLPPTLSPGTREAWVSLVTEFAMLDRRLQEVQQLVDQSPKELALQESARRMRRAADTLRLRCKEIEREWMAGCADE